MEKYFQSLSILFGLLILCSQQAWGESPWKFYGTNEEGSYYYDAETMTRPSKEMIRVWVQSAYTDQGISRWVRGGGEEFQNLGYTLVLIELNCVDRSLHSLQIVFYSRDKEVLTPINTKEWEFFAPDSMSEALYEALCKLNNANPERTDFSAIFPLSLPSRTLSPIPPHPEPPR
jgi:hypothetical protein